MLFTHSITINELRNSYNGYFPNINVNKNTETDKFLKRVNQSKNNSKK